MKSENLKWITFFILIIVICCIWFIFATKTSEEKYAEIYIDGEIIKKIGNLYPEEAEYMVVETDSGYNKVCWYDGEIWVEEADCENQTCVEFGRLSAKGLSIICAPHGMEIKIIDNESGADVTQ